MHYWDGQPVRFMCCERKRYVEKDGSEGSGADDVPWGRVLWCVAIEPVPDEEAVSQSQSRSETVNDNGGPKRDLTDDID